MTDEARAAVSELLELRGRSITLIPGRGTVVEKPGGGKDYTPSAPRSPQIFALFQVSSTKTGRVGKGFDATTSAASDNGIVRVFEYSMVGAYDAVVQVGDGWEDGLAKYQVESVDYSAAYQVGAVVTGFLKQPSHGNTLPFAFPVTWEPVGG
jgi:hypothetical protein